MHIKIEKKALLEAIQKLEAKKPIGKAKKAYLTGNVAISLADKTAIFQLDTAKVTVAADGVWDGFVSFPFQIAIALLKIPPKGDVITFEYLEGSLRIGPIKLKAIHTTHLSV
jgi:hypothetical protein